LKQILIYILISFHLIYLTGCSPKGVLTEPLLSSQTVKGVKTIPKERIEALLPQKPNKRLIKTPITLGLYFYQLFSAKIPPLTFKTYAENKKEWELELVEVQKNYQKSIFGLENTSDDYLKLTKVKDKKVSKLTRKINEGNWGMRTFGEQPSYFREQDAIKNVTKISTYLKNHGFFKNTVSYKVDTTFLNRNGVAVTYTINEGTIYPLKRTDSLVVEDRTIRELLSANQTESKFKVGDRFEVDNKNNELSRIEQLLKNNGYYNFSKENITIRVNDLDTAITKGIGSIVYIPNPSRPPLNNNYRKSYPLNKITFIADGTSSFISVQQVDTVDFKGIHYIFVNKKFSTKLLDSKIQLRPNELFRLSNKTQTEKNLYGLDQFQFTRINFDTTRGLLDATIYAKPLDKYQFTAETGGSVYQSVFGPFLNVSLKVRNLGGSASSWENTLRGGYEAQTGFFDTDVVKRNIELGLSTALIFPKLIAPNILAQKFNSFTPQTRLGIGTDYTSRQDYSRLNIKFTGSYLWRPSIKQFWQVSLVDLNLISTSGQSEAFIDYLDRLEREGNNLKQSFNTSFVSSISASYTYTDDPYGQIKNGNYLKVLLESGGTTLNLFPNNKIGFISNIFGENLQFYKFLRLNADYRKYLPIGKTLNSIFAYKLNLGLAYSYSEGKNLPYEKNFFVGGPSSLRAWQPRTLGPGSDTAFRKLDKPGSILFEASAEYRFKIFRFLGDYNFNGALFVDAGNVWRFEGQNTNGFEGSKFKLNSFYKEIAVGAGFGFRMDLSFFVIRTDFAVKVIDPAQLDGNRWVLFRDKSNFVGEVGKNGNSLIFNFGIGYPF
jgi:outer membrane protein assembly factor BamA